MTSAPATSDAPFAIGNYTSAPLQLDMELRFTNQSPAAVFDVMGDPEQIQNWYVLAKDTVVDEQTAEKELQFEVDFILFGKVREEVMLWNPPQRYVYRAFGEHFPFRDYVALIEIEEQGIQYRYTQVAAVLYPHRGRRQPAAPACHFAAPQRG